MCAGVVSASPMPTRYVVSKDARLAGVETQESYRKVGTTPFLRTTPNGTTIETTSLY